MNGFYDFGQRVHLRRDPSQFGLIGCGGYGDVYDAESGVQLVFWEHEGCDVVTCELAADLMSEQEYHERRVLFFHIMRQPEARLLLHALRALHIEYDVDWRAIQSAEIDTWGERNDCWRLSTEAFQVYTLCAKKPGLSRYDFFFDWYHVDGPMCPCEMCAEERRQEQERYARNIGGWLALVSESVAMIWDEIGVPLSEISSVEFVPNIGANGWWMSMNEGEIFAEVYWSPISQRLDVAVSGFAGDVVAELCPLEQFGAAKSERLAQS